MEKYQEQKSKIKTVSIGRIYEWVSKFLQELEKEFKEDDQLSRYLKEEIIKKYDDCRKIYLKYVSLRRRHAFEILKVRKELCDELLKVLGHKGLLSDLEKNIKTIYMESNLTSFNKLDDFKNSDNFNKLDNGLKPKMGEINDEEYKKVKTCANKVLSLINDYKSNSKKAIEKDLGKIKKETDVTSVISSVMTNKNKISHEKEALMPILSDYSDKVVPFVKSNLYTYSEILKGYKINPENSNCFRVISNMIKCWENDYSEDKIEKAKINKKYCRELFLKLESIAEKEGISGTREIGLLFTQLATKLVTHLDVYIKENSQKQSKEDLQKFIDGWIKEFNKKFGEIKDEKMLLNEENSENIQEFYKSAKDLAIDFNNEMKKHVNYIHAFNTAYTAFFKST